jgi:drug/metabolite transporter (DMT)-like permease
MPVNAADPLATSPVRGILLASTAFALFTLMDCAVKVLGGRYHPLQIVWLQTTVGMALMLALTRRRGGIERLRTRRPGLHLLRGLLALVSLNAAFYAYAVMPLADAYAVLFTVPLLVTALSRPLLGEHVGRSRWAAVALGFLGVLVMVRPSPGGLVAGTVLIPLGGALATALGYLLVRRMQATETTESLCVYGNLVMIVAVTPLLPLVLVPPPPADLGLGVLGGVLGAAAVVLLIEAYRSAPAAVVAPFQYCQMPYAVLAGVLLFDDWPEPRVLLGGAIVALSGIYLLRHETARQRRPQPQRAAAAQASQ